MQIYALKQCNGHKYFSLNIFPVLLLIGGIFFLSCLGLRYVTNVLEQIPWECVDLRRSDAI